MELSLIINMSMAYILERPEGDRTRLMSRVRVHIQGGLALPYIYLFDEGSEIDTTVILNEYFATSVYEHMRELPTERMPYFYKATPLCE